jgi:hypothetical protein
MLSKGTKTAADAAWLFNVHPATVSRLLASADAGTGEGEGVSTYAEHKLDSTLPAQQVPFPLRQPALGSKATPARRSKKAKDFLALVLLSTVRRFKPTVRNAQRGVDMARG